MTTVRIRGEEQPGFLEILSNWLPHQPWFPTPRGRRSLTRVGGLRLPTPQGDPDSGLFLEHHVFDVELPQGPQRISVPVALRSRPSALAGKTAFIGKLTDQNGKDLWVYDGARDRAFLAAWLEMARRRQGSRNGRSRGEALAGFETWDAFELQMRRSAVQAQDASHTRTLVAPEDAAEEGDWEKKVVVDFLRRPTQQRTPLLETVLTLTRANSRSVPRVLGTISGAWEKTATAADEAEWENGDLSVIREAGVEAPSAWDLARAALKAGRSFSAEAGELGRWLGTFHADLAGAFGAHPQSTAQLKSMAQNAQVALSSQWAGVREEFDEDEAADLHEVIDLMTMQLRDADEPLMLQQIHGDLSLGHAHQMTPQRWVFNESDGLIERALGLRDVVTMLMSAANLVMEVANETPEASSTEEGEAQAPVNFGQWYEEFTKSFLKGYRSSDVDASGVDSVFFRAAMLAEALELFAQWEGSWVFRPSMLLQVEG